MTQGTLTRVRIAIAAGAAALVAMVVPTSGGAAAPDLTTPAARDTEPVILTGSDLGSWSARSNTTVKLPFGDFADCPYQVRPEKVDPQNLGPSLVDALTPSREDCPHNRYADPDVDTQEFAPQQGTPTDRLLGYRWDPAARRFEQIPFQVDEVFTRYLENSASGYSPYSGQEAHTTYAYDREGFRYRSSDPDNPCVAKPDSEVAKDPVRGLDDNDELVFMASDAGPAAPREATLPEGVEEVRAVRVSDPSNPTAGATHVYVMKAENGGPRPAFDEAGGYVEYRRDANADFFEKSESTYSGYGNAPRGVVCDAQGNPVADNERRRPRDYAWIETDRYKFRYDGRWLMTQIRISDDGGVTFGPDLVDRWKARAYAQDPGSKTPCCGFEEEDTNWGGSSNLLGERAGPVRAIRETWGADSGTHVTRRETFYGAELRQKTSLRVHVIPPLDGIYAQWDFNAGRMTRFYNSNRPEGVPVDGRNDEAFGNLDDPCNLNYDANDTSDFDQGYRTLYRSLQLCRLPYHQSMDPGDPTFGDLNVALGWSQTSGPHGTIVDRYSASVKDLSPLGTAQALMAVPYYRDDSCFDDGTGTDPGPKVNLRSGDEPRTASDGSPRRCWHPEDGLPDGSDRFFQGSIATHGTHLLFVAESDNLRQTVPLSEIVAEQRMVMLPGQQPNVGERYGRGFEKPLLAVVTSAPGFQEPVPGMGRGAESGRAGAGGQADRRAARRRPTLTLRARRASRRRVVLRWRGRGDVTGYSVEAAGPRGWRQLLRDTSRRIFTVRARPGTTLRFRVRATGRDGSRSRFAYARVRVPRR